MLEIRNSFVWSNEKGPWVGGYHLGLMHIPPKYGLQLGVGGGFAREEDARMAERNLRETYPYFDFDDCTLEEWDAFYKNQGEDTIIKVLCEHLQW